MLRSALKCFSAVMAAAALVACGGGGGSSGGGEGGGGSGGGSVAPEPKDYYNGAESAALGATGNAATCGTCHSDDGTQENWSGNTLKDMAYHTSFKGGMAPTLLDGANACVTGWMGGEALVATDPAWLGLKEYIESISDEAMTTPNEIMPEVLDDEAAYEAAYAGGDAAAGAKAYAQACARCHDTGLKINQVVSFPKATLKTYTIGRIAQKVRTSGPPPSDTKGGADSTPGPMPFFEMKDLSAQALKDIIAHIKG